MNSTSEASRFCEQCGASLPQQAKFCEICGQPVQEPSHSAPQPTRAPSVESSKSRRIIPLSTLVAAAAALLLLAFLGITWMSRAQLSPPEPLSSVETPNPASATPLSQTESQNPATPPSTVQDAPEDPLNDWLVQQAWFTRLRQSLPQGVRASFHFFEQEPEDGFHWLEIREFRSPDSGYDPDVSPMIGIFRISRDRSRTEHLDAVTAEWTSTNHFLESRGIPVEATDSVISPPAGIEPSEFTPAPPPPPDQQVHTPERGSALRAQISDSARQFLIRDLGADAPKEPFLFVIEELRVKDRHAFFQGYPVKPDGSALPGFVGDTVFTFVLEKEREGWLVFTDLTRSDVPTADEVRNLRLSFTADFPKEVLSDFWKDLLFP